MPDGDSTIQKLKCAHVLGLKSIMDEHKEQAPYPRLEGRRGGQRRFCLEQRPRVRQDDLYLGKTQSRWCGLRLRQGSVQTYRGLFGAGAEPCTPLFFFLLPSSSSSFPSLKLSLHGFYITDSGLRSQQKDRGLPSSERGQKGLLVQPEAGWISLDAPTFLSGAWPERTSHYKVGI